MNRFETFLVIDKAFKIRINSIRFYVNNRQILTD